MGHSEHGGHGHSGHKGHKFPVEQMARLDSPERLSLLPVDAVVSLSGARPGMRILDVGCGPGVFTIPLARAVGSTGRVDAADILPEMVAACRARAAAAGVTNVEVALSTENSIPFPDGCADLVLACHLLHELHDPPLFFAELRRLLAPDGRLVVVDWEKIETGIGPPVDKRVTAEEAAALLEANGFVVESRAPVTWANYLLRARAATPRP
jgi:ubiquinone/menaquinone biosynthesis C-methylase UbiE